MATETKCDHKGCEQFHGWEKPWRALDIYRKRPLGCRLGIHDHWQQINYMWRRCFVCGHEWRWQSHHSQQSFEHSRANRKDQHAL